MAFLNGKSIRVDYFLTFLAYRKYPLRDNSVGIECIVGGQISVRSSSGSEVNWFPVELSSEDFQQLEWTLEVLPELRYPVSQADAELFMQGFLRLKGRPGWLPRLLESHHIRRDNINRANLYVDLKRKFAEFVNSGRFRIYNSTCEYIKFTVDDALLDFANVEDYASEIGIKIFSEEIACADLPYINVFSDTTELLRSIPLGLSDRLFREGIPSPQQCQGGLMGHSYGFQRLAM